MLEDDRKKYADPKGPVKSEAKQIENHLSNPKLLGDDRVQILKTAPTDSPEYREVTDYAMSALSMDGDDLEKAVKILRDERINNLKGGQTKLDMNNDDMLDAKDFEMLRDQNAEGGDIDGQMTMLMMSKKPEEEMLPDDEMEDEYLDFILDEALDNDEEEYLMSQLQGNEQLSEIFDKVIDVAQEFAGSGPVEGPGSGVSDSIPARLSDGEFVFTAKAVEEIGADNLMAMMKDAEMKADDRQGLAEGGEPEEETVVVKGDDPVKQEIRVVKETVDNGGRMMADEDEIAKNIISNMMLDPNQQHVRS
jgi:hypothetical protein